MTEAKRVSYQDVKSSVLESIRNNTWGPGSTLPGEVELAEYFGCARATVNRAIRELADEGFVERKRKAGTTVKSSPSRQARFHIPVVREEIEKSGGVYSYALVTRDVSDAPNWLRTKMELAPDTKVLRLQCLHKRNGKPYQLEDRWINANAVPEVLNIAFDDIGPNEWLVRKVPFTEVELSFSARRATHEVAEFLGMSEGDAVFTAERVTWLNGQSVTFARFHHHQGYQMRTQI